LVAFSSYTCSLEFVHKVGYWDKDVIPEDSRSYWKPFFTFGNRFSVKSVWLPIYGDSPQARDYAATHVSQYNQIKRWAWGITDVPYVLARFFKHPEIPLVLRFRRFMNLFLNHLNWIFLPVLLIFGASVPISVSIEFSLTDLRQTLWSISCLLLGGSLSTVVCLLYFRLRTRGGTFRGLVHVLAEGFRRQGRGLDHGTLNWRPLPKANSIAVLVTHSLGSEREMLRSVRLVATERDREAEFSVEAEAGDLL